MQNRPTNRPRGFGFISFESEHSVVRVMEKTDHVINGRTVEVKKALPKDAMNAKGSGYTRGGRNPSDGAAVSGSCFSHGTGYHYPSGYATFPDGFPGYSYGTGAYVQTYPGFPTFLSRSRWSGNINMMTGPSMYSIPYNCYTNDGVSSPGVYNRAIVPSFYGHLHQIHGGNGHLLTTGMPSPSADSHVGTDST